jgi:hypothetical protein
VNPYTNDVNKNLCKLDENDVDCPGCSVFWL